MDTSSPVAIFKALLPKTPLIGKVALLHTLGLSENSKHWDLRTALVVNVLRSFVVDSSETLSQRQRLSLRDPGVKGRIWISRVKIPRPDEDDVRQVIFRAINGLKDPEDAPGGYQEPQLLPVEAEWTGYRAGATKTSLEPEISEEQKYKELMSEVSSPVTVLYFHGGAYYLMDPSSHRPTTKKLAKLTGGRCLSIRYRLAPQNPFPAALLDALVSYLALLHPPAGSFHTAVKPCHIVFAGDSAGGNLCLALLQTILELQRQNLKIRWNGDLIEVPVPAGVALCSPWADITHSSPSCETNAAYDYLPPQSMQIKKMDHRQCSIWPVDPPRKNLYAEDAMLHHPLVSPLAARSWEGSCPMYIGTGTEILTDEAKFVAMRAACQGVPVVFEEYEAMPHCFAMILTALPGSRRFFSGWAGFILEVTQSPENVKTKGVLVKSKTLQEVPLEVQSLAPYTYGEVHLRMIERAKKLAQVSFDPAPKL